MNIDQNTCEVTFHDKTYDCPITMVMDLIGGKWKTVILYYLKEKPKRFTQLKSDMPKITEMTLSLQLKQLEKHGFISRTVFGDKPPVKVIYQLTAFGQTFIPVLDALSEWASKFAEKSDKIAEQDVSHQNDVLGQ